jgi:hypothetical protein
VNAAATFGQCLGFAAVHELGHCVKADDHRPRYSALALSYAPLSVGESVWAERTGNVLALDSDAAHTNSCDISLLEAGADTFGELADRIGARGGYSAAIQDNCGNSYSYTISTAVSGEEALGNGKWVVRNPAVTGGENVIKRHADLSIMESPAYLLNAVLSPQFANSELGSVVSGKVVYASTKKLDIQSLPMEFEVRGVDEAEAARVDLLLKSGVRRDNLEGLALLETARAELFRRATPSLPPLFRSRDTLVRTAALRVLLARFELTEPLSDAELYEALDAASREPDAALRLAAARVLIRIRNQLGRGDIVRTYDSKRLRDWYEGETSDECRSLLVSVNTLPLEFMVKVAQRDTSPHVRAVAVRWLSDFAPENLLKVADSFGTLSGEVEMDGKRQLLAAFVAEELNRARKRVDWANRK